MTDSFNATDEYDYDDLPEQSSDIFEMHQMRTRLKFLYVLVYAATLLLGTPLNSTIIILMAKKRPHQWIQIMGLAITHLAFCLVTPLYLISAWNGFNWTFGKPLCKAGSYVMFMNMFCNSLILSLWNGRSLVRNRCCSPRVFSGVTLLAYFLAAILAVPSLLSRDVQKTASGEICRDNYDYVQTASMSVQAKSRMFAVVLSRFVVGLVLIVAVIGIRTCVRWRRLRQSAEGQEEKSSEGQEEKSSEGQEERSAEGQVERSAEGEDNSKVLCPATVAHFLCWTPVLSISMVQVVLWMDSQLFTQGLPFTTGLCSLNSVIYPFICLIWGRKEWNSKPVEDKLPDENIVPLVSK